MGTKAYQNYSLNLPEPTHAQDASQTPLGSILELIWYPFLVVWLVCLVGVPCVRVCVCVCSVVWLPGHTHTHPHWGHLPNQPNNQATIPGGMRGATKQKTHHVAQYLWRASPASARTNTMEIIKAVWRSS